MIGFTDLMNLITALAALGAFALSWHNASRLNTVSHQTNSMQVDMVKMTRQLALAEGIKKGRSDLLDEQGGTAPRNEDR